MKLGPGTAIILTDRRLVKELIDKRGSIYSDRPRSYVFHDLITGGDHVLVARYGPKWRMCRKLIAQHFGEGVVDREHVRVVEAEARQLVRDMMVMPEGHMWHPRRFSHSVGSSCIWGMRTPTVGNELMLRLYAMMEKLGVLVVSVCHLYGGCYDASRSRRCKTDGTIGTRQHAAGRDAAIPALCSGEIAWEVEVEGKGRSRPDEQSIR